LQWLFAFSENFLQNWQICTAILIIMLLQICKVYFAINRLLSDIPLLPFLKLDSAIPSLTQNPAKIEEYDVFLKQGNTADEQLQ
jgi:hypothetical protein